MMVDQQKQWCFHQQKCWFNRLTMFHSLTNKKQFNHRQLGATIKNVGLPGLPIKNIGLLTNRKGV